MKAYRSILYLAAICLAAEAQANELESRRMEIYYGDLNLSSPSGRNLLSNRVRLAIKRACEQAGVAGLASRSDHNCRHQAFETANADMEKAIVAARGK